MRQNKSITVDVAPDGSVKIEGHGFVGPECEKATAFLEEALGTVTKRVHKREYLERPVVAQNARQR